MVISKKQTEIRKKVVIELLEEATKNMLIKHIWTLYEKLIQTTTKINLSKIQDKSIDLVSDWKKGSSNEEGLYKITHGIDIPFEKINIERLRKDELLDIAKNLSNRIFI